VDVNLYLKDVVIDLKHKSNTTLIQSAEKYQNVLLPGYTHLQIAMPSSFGMWFSAYAETLIDDHHVKCCSKVVDQNPWDLQQVTAAPSLLIEHLPQKNWDLNTNIRLPLK
jgi:argininosuccinate lyase